MAQSDKQLRNDGMAQQRSSFDPKLLRSINKVKKINWGEKEYL